MIVVVSFGGQTELWSVIFGSRILTEKEGETERKRGRERERERDVRKVNRNAVKA